MREILTFTPEQTLPSESTLLRDQGLPDRARLSARLADGFDEAVGLFRALAEPRAVVQEVERSLVESILEEAGPLEERPVVGRILDKAGACALYVATLGEPVSERIRGLFAEHDLALGWTLDSVASSAADRFGELLATRFRDALVGRGAVDPRVLPYSPGYCGWPTRGQGSLFEEINPACIGVRLTDSFLMLPVKSVSGVLLAGDSRTHLFGSGFDFCGRCTTHACEARMASVSDS